MSKNYSEDISLFICCILKRLDAFKFDNFEERMKNQKYYYLAQIFQVAPKFNYNLYIKGPYSSDLSDTIFEFYRKEEKIPTDAFVIDDLEFNFKLLKLYIKEKSVRDLELVTTLYWLIKDAKMNYTDALSELKRVKVPSELELGRAELLLGELKNELKKIKEIK